MARKKPRATAGRRVGPDAGPPERAQHGDTEAREVFDKDTGRHLGQGRRVLSPVAMLRGVPKDVHAVWIAAAERLYGDYTQMIHGIDRDRGESHRVDTSRDPLSCTPSEFQIQAGRDYEAARRALTAYEWPALKAVVCEEVPIFIWAAQQRINQMAASERVKAALARLTDHYHERDHDHRRAA